MSLLIRIAVNAVVLGAGSVAWAQITPVAPFAGEFTDTFDQYNTNMAVQSLPVFEGMGTLENLSPGGAIKVEFSSSLAGDLVVPISDMMAGQLGIAQWVFERPMCRFGGWFENNSGADDATLAFHDAGGRLIGEVTADVAAGAQRWTWNGWSSDVPFARIVVSGNGLVNGFIWFENVQLDSASCPTDLDGDGMSGVEDLIAVILAWNTAGGRADIDGSGTVDVGDLIQVVLAWGPCPCA